MTIKIGENSHYKTGEIKQTLIIENRNYTPTITTNTPGVNGNLVVNVTIKENETTLNSGFVQFKSMEKH